MLFSADFLASQELRTKLTSSQRHSMDITRCLLLVGGGVPSSSCVLGNLVVIPSYHLPLLLIVFRSEWKSLKSVAKLFPKSRWALHTVFARYLIYWWRNRGTLCELSQLLLWKELWALPRSPSIKLTSKLKDATLRTYWLKIWRFSLLRAAGDKYNYLTVRLTLIQSLINQVSLLHG